MALAAFVAPNAFAEPHCVILFIGDGMGPQQIRAASEYGYGENGRLVFQQFPLQVTVTTLAYGGLVTDSAASSTAMATGTKVGIGVVGLEIPGSSAELPTLLDAAVAQGRPTGLVTTAVMVDATPAAFGAHTDNRYNYAEIAQDYLTGSRPNVLFGGGTSLLDRATVEAAGYVMVDNRPSLLALAPNAGDHIAGLFGSGDFSFVYDGRGVLPSLPEMVSKALDILDGDPDGFFLMVEAARIDDACHGSNILRAVGELLELDDAVKTAMEWAKGRTDTAIIVTADHETGGLELAYSSGQGEIPAASWSTVRHTDTPVPLYAWTNDSSLTSFKSEVLFTAQIDNTEIFALAQDFGYVPLPATSLARLLMCVISLAAAGALLNAYGSRKRADA